MFLKLFFRKFAAINIVKLSKMNKKLNFYNETYNNNIPLSVIYKQFIRFMKENGIYTPYLEISFPKTKMSYTVFWRHLHKFSLVETQRLKLERLFTLFFIVGSDYELYSKYINDSNDWSDAVGFLNDINKKWRSFLLELESLYCTEKN